MINILEKEGRQAQIPASTGIIQMFKDYRDCFSPSHREIVREGGFHSAILKEKVSSLIGKTSNGSLKLTVRRKGLKKK